MAHTGSDEEEQRNPGGVNVGPNNVGPNEAGYPTTVGQTAAVAGAGESGVAPSVAVPAGNVGWTVSRDALLLGPTHAAESADIDAEPTGEPGTETDGAGGWPATSWEVVAGLVVARGDAAADPVVADGAVATESVASPVGTDLDAVEVGSDGATLAATPPQEDSGHVESGLPPKPRRISKPMLAAAAIAGVVLIAIPFALGSMGRHDTPRDTGADAAVLSKDGGSSSGFVPSPEPGIPENAGASGADKTVEVPASGQTAEMPASGQTVEVPAAGQAVEVPAAGQAAVVPKQVGAVKGAAQPAPHEELAASPAPPPVTSSATSASVKVSGQVSCTSGKSVVGVWVAAAQGSGFASWKGLGNGSTSDYWYWLPTSEPYSLHVGCGGTPERWAVATYSPQVSGTHNSFNCIDVSGQRGYKSCVAR